MEGESTTQASTPARAVFLSYASQCGSHAITSVPQRSFQCPLCRKLRVLLEWPELAAYRRSGLYSRVGPKAGRVSRAIKRERTSI
jgi:hypothetical protein